MTVLFDNLNDVNLPIVKTRKKCSRHNCKNPDKDENGKLDLYEFRPNASECRLCSRERDYNNGRRNKDKFKALKRVIDSSVGFANARSKELGLSVIDKRYIYAMVVASKFRCLITNKNLLNLANCALSLDHIKCLSSSGMNIHENIIMMHRFVNFGKNHHPLNWALYVMYTSSGLSKKETCIRIGQVRKNIMIAQMQSGLYYKDIQYYDDKQLLQYLRDEYSKLTNGDTVNNKDLLTT